MTRHALRTATRNVLGLPLLVSLLAFVPTPALAQAGATFQVTTTADNGDDSEKLGTVKCAENANTLFRISATGEKDGKGRHPWDERYVGEVLCAGDGGCIQPTRCCGARPIRTSTSSRWPTAS